MNVKWGSCIAGGNHADGHIYLQTPDDRKNAKWQIEQDEQYHDFYYIKDLQHEQYIFSGYKYDGHVYQGELDASNLDNYRWKLEVVRTDPDPRGGQTVYLIDGDHGKALVAGSGDDNAGQVNLIDNPKQPYAEWGFVALST